jgi:hypothetical protein
MQTAACGGAGAGNVSAVLGNLGLHQYDIQHGAPPLGIFDEQITL